MISFLFWFVYVYFFLRQGFSVCRFGAFPLIYSLHKLASNSHRASCLCFQVLGLKVWATTASRQCVISNSKLPVNSEGLSEFIVYICKHVQWSHVRRKPMEFAAPVSQLLLWCSCTWGRAWCYYSQGRDFSSNSFQGRWCLLSWAFFKLHISLGTQMELRIFFPQRGWGKKAWCLPSLELLCKSLCPSSLSFCQVLSWYKRQKEYI